MIGEVTIKLSKQATIRMIENGLKESFVKDQDFTVTDVMMDYSGCRIEIEGTEKEVGDDTDN